MLDFFLRHLPTDWGIYIQPHLNGLRPDFVLLHPRIGIAVYEVKSWDLDAMPYRYMHAGTNVPVLWATSPAGVPFRVEDDPVEKVQRYRQALLDVICPRIGLAMAEHFAAGVVLTAGVIMTDCSTVRARTLFEPILDAHGALSQRWTAYNPVAGRDALDRGALGVVLPSAGLRESRYMTAQLAVDLRSWLVEPDIAAAQRQPLPLNARQLELVRSRTRSGYRRIKGPAGSGKSQVVAARAAELSAQGKDVLVVTYNITLWHYLHDLAVRHPAPGRALTSRITWCHFHAWCKDVCHEAGQGDAYRQLWAGEPEQDDEPRRDEILERRLPDLVGQVLAERHPEVPTYDAILVDEGQDFNIAWWNLLRRVLRPAGEMLLVADKTQDVYGKAKAWTDGPMPGAGFPGGEWARLQGSLRLPRGLVPHLRELVRRFLPSADVDLPEETQIEMDLFPLRLRWVQTAPASAARVCVDELLRMPALAAPDGLAYADVTLLTESHKIGLTCVGLLGESNVRVAHAFGESHRARKAQKIGFYMGDARVKASTVQSFKGWEARAIVLHIARGRTAADVAAAYVGMTRLKRAENGGGSYLTVVCSVPEMASYGATWPEHRFAETPSPDGDLRADRVDALF